MCSLHAHLIDSYFIDCLHISLYGSYFYPRDAMLAQVGLLAMALCPSVCLSVCVCPSVTNRCSIEMAVRIELVFGMGASFHPSYTV